LYVTFGDGGGPNDQFNNAQDRKTLLGAMLRISVPVKDGGAVYTIPKTNPYQPGNAQGFLPEIYAYGQVAPLMINLDNDYLTVLLLQLLLHMIYDKSVIR
jgi:Glucose / Sorbosone dehydrogenase